MSSELKKMMAKKIKQNAEAAKRSISVVMENGAREYLLKWLEELIADYDKLVSSNRCESQIYMLLSSRSNDAYSNLRIKDRHVTIEIKYTDGQETKLSELRITGVLVRWSNGEELLVDTSSLVLRALGIEG